MANLPGESIKGGERVAVGGTHRAANAFVPAYDDPGAIRVPARPRPEAFERRQLGRLIERRRLSS